MVENFKKDIARSLSAELRYRIKALEIQRVSKAKNGVIGCNERLRE